MALKALPAWFAQHEEEYIDNSAAISFSHYFWFLDE
jgi:hypothetical protein